MREGPARATSDARASSRMSARSWRSVASRGRAQDRQHVSSGSLGSRCRVRTAYALASRQPSPRAASRGWRSARSRELAQLGLVQGAPQPQTAAPPAALPFSQTPPVVRGGGRGPDPLRSRSGSRDELRHESACELITAASHGFSPVERFSSLASKTRMDGRPAECHKSANSKSRFSRVSALSDP